MLRRHCLEISPPVVESHNSALFSSHNKAPPSPGITSVVPPERSTRLDSNSHTQGKDLFGPFPCDGPRRLTKHATTAHTVCPVGQFFSFAPRKFQSRYHQ